MIYRNLLAQSMFVAAALWTTQRSAVASDGSGEAGFDPSALSRSWPEPSTPAPNNSFVMKALTTLAEYMAAGGPTDVPAAPKEVQPVGTMAAEVLGPPALDAANEVAQDQNGVPSYRLGTLAKYQAAHTVSFVDTAVNDPNAMAAMVDQMAQQANQN